MTLDGPFVILDLSASPTITTDAFGQEVVAYPPAPGEHYKTDPETLAAFADLLGPYVVAPSRPLQNVWAGDDPADYVLTVPLRFPDPETAEGVRAAIFPPETAP